VDRGASYKSAETVDVVIVGGGLAGLSAGLALAQAGLRPLILEAGSGAGAADRWGLTIWPPGVRVLDWLGVLDDVTEQGCQLQSLSWCAAGVDGEINQDLRSFSAMGTFIAILPSRLNRILSFACQKWHVPVLPGVESCQFRNSNDGVEVSFVRDGKPGCVKGRLLIGADGPASRVCSELGTPSWRWRLPGQVIQTGIGGAFDRREYRQILGRSWALGIVSVNETQSWIYFVLPRGSSKNFKEICQLPDWFSPQTCRTFEQCQLTSVAPSTVRVLHWASDSAVLIGDAAHCMPPHLGLGGTMTLEDIPVLTEVIVQAIQRKDTSTASLREFQQRRRARTAYAQRISEMWGMMMMGSSPFRPLRDLSFRRLIRTPEIVDNFLCELASAEVPALGTRLRMWMP